MTANSFGSRATLDAGGATHEIYRLAAVEGSETRVWAAQDPADPVKLRGVPIPAEVIERFRAA